MIGGRNINHRNFMAKHLEPLIEEEVVEEVIEEDVLEEEPMRKEHPLLAIQNKERLYVTPHIAWSSFEARERLVASIVANIKQSL